MRGIEQSLGTVTKLTLYQFGHQSAVPGVGN